MGDIRDRLGRWLSTIDGETPNDEFVHCCCCMYHNKEIIKRLHMLARDVNDIFSGVIPFQLRDAVSMGLHKEAMKWDTAWVKHTMSRKTKS